MPRHPGTMASESAAKHAEICGRLATCPFFNSLSLPSVADTLRTLYCRGSYASCARYEMAQAGRPVPLELWPNGSMG